MSRNFDGAAEPGLRPVRLRPLRVVVREELRRRILAGEWAVGERLPTEDELCREFAVSRVTVRSAIQALAAQGLVDIRHGSGTYVATFGGQLRAGLQELRSMTEVIRELGHHGGSVLDWKETRYPTEAEANLLGIASDSHVVSMERTWMADGEVVGYSFDAIPADMLPPALTESLGSESTFTTFRRFGIEPARAMAELHAVDGVPPAHNSNAVEGSLYLLLDQVHYDRGARAIMYSRTYFVEGRFSFVILRTV
ncbi:MAG: GntR family transcriptional regulator [Actinomycetota bacterium]|nr:GntR family transcriptional regulator [Actinomycetota bacterium]